MVAYFSPQNPNHGDVSSQEIQRILGLPRRGGPHRLGGRHRGGQDQEQDDEVEKCRFHRVFLIFHLISRLIFHLIFHLISHLIFHLIFPVIFHIPIRTD